MITKEELDKLVEKYENSEFINNDPIKFLHKFKNEEDATLAGFLASCIAYGNRKVFIKKIDELLEIMDNKPYDFIINFEPKMIKNYNYRFTKENDFINFFKKLNALYKDKKTLKYLFESNYNGEIISMLQAVCNYFYQDCNLTQGYCHLVPDPKKGGTLKRLNMFLRWMVRKPPVDLAMWNFIPTSNLVIPFDTHVARMSREMGLLSRNSNDYKAVIELTNNLKQFDKNDPVKYDFALFGYGISHPIVKNNSKKKHSFSECVFSAS